MARLLEQYTTTIAPSLAKKFNLTNKLAIPKLEKIVINMGVGRATQDCQFAAFCVNLDKTWTSSNECTECIERNCVGQCQPVARTSV